MLLNNLYGAMPFSEKIIKDKELELRRKYSHLFESYTCESVVEDRGEKLEKDFVGVNGKMKNLHKIREDMGRMNKKEKQELYKNIRKKYKDLMA